MVDAQQKLLDAGFHFVSFRPRSEWEMRNFLKKKMDKWAKFDKQIFDQVLDKLRNYGYVDDTKFVAWWVEQRNVHRPRGVSILMSELRDKGISAQILKKLLQEEPESVAADSENQLAGAQKIVAKLAVRLTKYPKPDQKQKLIQALLRRGFGYDLVRRVVDERLTKDYNEIVD